MCPRIIATAIQIGLSIRSSRRFSAYSKKRMTATGIKYNVSVIPSSWNQCSEIIMSKTLASGLSMMNAKKRDQIRRQNAIAPV